MDIIMRAQQGQRQDRAFFNVHGPQGKPGAKLIDSRTEFFKPQSHRSFSSDQVVLKHPEGFLHTGAFLDWQAVIGALETRLDNELPPHLPALFAIE